MRVQSVGTRSWRRPARALRGVVLSIGLALGAAGVGHAEPVSDAGLWSLFAAQGDFAAGVGDPWRARWAFDGQARFLEDANGFNQSLFRPSLGVDVAESAAVWLGYAWIRTEPSVGGSIDEHRIFQQLTWTQSIRTVSVYSRTRLEQRFIEGNDDVAWRFREFVKIGVPIGIDERFRLVAYDEVFIHANDANAATRSGFDQNRLFAGIGIPIGGYSGATLEIGYLNQFVRRSRGEDRVNHILSVNLFFSL